MCNVCYIGAYLSTRKAEIFEMLHNQFLRFTRSEGTGNAE